MRLRRLLMLLPLLGSCERQAGGPRAACGMAALAGPTALLAQFGIAGQTLSVPPRNLPERLVTRVVAGPALPSIVGRADSALVIGVEGTLPPASKPAYGVLVVDPSAKARGVMLYEGNPVEAAPQIGTVTIGGATVPLLGVQVDPTRIEDPRCPAFPDSVIR